MNTRYHRSSVIAKTQHRTLPAILAEVEQRRRSILLGAENKESRATSNHAYVILGCHDRVPEGRGRNLALYL